MSLMNIFHVAGSAVSAQSQRLNVVASNLANVDTVAGPDGQAYRARQVTFATHFFGATGHAGVRVSTISEDATPGRRVHDPRHPGANADGYVKLIKKLRERVPDICLRSTFIAGHPGFKRNYFGVVKSRFCGQFFDDFNVFRVPAIFFFPVCFPGVFWNSAWPKRI